MIRFASSIFAVLLVLISATALAQTPPSEAARASARSAYAAGQEAFRAGRFEEAIRSFEAAYAAVPNGVVFKSIAECYERLNNVRGVVESLERYLREVNNATDRAAIEARVRDLRARPAHLTVATTPANATVTVDGQQRMSNNNIELTPGEHTVVVSAAGHDNASRTLTLGFAETQSINVQLMPTAVAAVPATPVTQPAAVAAAPATTEASTTEASTTEASTSDAEASANVEASVAQATATESQGPSTGIQAGIWTGVGFAAAGLVSGTVLGFMALNAEKDFDEMPSHSTEVRGTNYAIFADVSFLVAAGGALTALTLYLTDGQDEQPAATDAAAPTARRQNGVRWSVAPMISPQVGGASAQITF